MSINQSELVIIIRNIFKGIVSPILEKTFNQVYKGEVNQVFHRKLIEEIDIRAKREMKDMVISMISLHSKPIIDIVVRTVTNPGKPTEYYIFGSDLRKYHMYLPKICDKETAKLLNPRTGAKHSKWYPFFVSQTMKNIALHLRMLDLYLKTNRIIITQNYNDSTTGILGLEVSFEIPESFEEIITVEDIKNSSNPIKKCDGIYIYGKNGVSNEKITNIASTIASISKFKNVFPKQVSSDEEIIDFIKAPQTFAIGLWEHHARVLIKDNECKIIDILDPWKREFNELLFFTLERTLLTCGWSVNFISRRIAEQVRGEGSCVLVAFARLLFLASCSTTINKTKYNSLIPDFFAFLSSHFYRKTL